MAERCHGQNVGVSLIYAAGLDENWIATPMEDLKHRAVGKKTSDFEALSNLHMHLRVQMFSSELFSARGHVQRLQYECSKMKEMDRDECMIALKYSI